MKFVVYHCGQYYRKFFTYAEAIEFLKCRGFHKSVHLNFAIFPVPNDYIMKETGRWAYTLNGARA